MSPTAVDERVIDILNVQPLLKHHFSAYGFWSPALQDYMNHRILARYETPAFTRLMELEDPYFYKDRITVPKYIINATGDEFFLPDSSQFYFHNLVGEKYLHYLPNTDHSMKDSDAFQSMAAFYSSIIPLPKVTWLYFSRRPRRRKIRRKDQSIQRLGGVSILLSGLGTS